MYIRMYTVLYAAQLEGGGGVGLGLVVMSSAMRHNEHRLCEQHDAVPAPCGDVHWECTTGGWQVNCL